MVHLLWVYYALLGRLTKHKEDMAKFQVYPADAQGRCLRGFCPTVCDTEQDAQEQAEWLVAALFKYGYKYNHIVTEER